MSNKPTRARYICSKEPEVLVGFIEMLPFRVEIKSYTFAKGKHFCWFNLPDTDSPIVKKFKSLDLDEV